MRVYKSGAGDGYNLLIDGMVVETDRKGNATSATPEEEWDIALGKHILIDKIDKYLAGQLIKTALWKLRPRSN